KIALLALGYTGALTYFAPLQPILAALSIVLLVVAVIIRLKGQYACPVPSSERSVPHDSRPRPECELLADPPRRPRAAGDGPAVGPRAAHGPADHRTLGDRSRLHHHRHRADQPRAQGTRPARAPRSVGPARPGRQPRTAHRGDDAGGPGQRR